MRSNSSKCGIFNDFQLAFREKELYRRVERDMNQLTLEPDNDLPELPEFPDVPGTKIFKRPDNSKSW